MTTTTTPVAAFFPSLTQMRVFSEVARLNSISRASEELRRSQSAVTQAVQQLEAELDVTLFTRTSTGSYLTEIGRILNRRISSFLTLIDAALLTLMKENALDLSHHVALARRITKSQILALTAVQEHGSFAQAARHVNVSLASLHRSARSLEQQIGLKLFKYTAHGATTNGAGRKLSGQFNLAVRELEWAQEEIRYHKGRLEGRLLVGALMLASSHFIAEEISQFMPEHPNVKVTLINGTYDVLLAKLRSGSIDFLLGHLKDPPPIKDVVEETLGADAYRIAGSRHHWRSKAPVSLAELRAAEWVAAPTSARRRAVFDKVFEGGPLPHFCVETHSLPAIFVLLTSSKRLALMTESELALDARLGNKLAALDYEIDQPPAMIGLTMRKFWEPTPLQRHFLDFLRARSLAALRRKAGKERVPDVSLSEPVL